MTSANDIRPLPNNWARCSIGDVLLPVDKIDPQSDPDREIIYIDISSIDNEKNRIGETKSVLLKEAPSRARQVVKSGDVLFSTVRPYLRNIAAVRPEHDGEVASTGFSVLRPATGIEPAFLFYKAISSDFVNSLSRKQYGVSYPAVKDEQVRAEWIDLPPEAEQLRIIAKIEELFSELDSGIDSLKTAREQLCVYRQALLKNAFEGKLTTLWREKNADKLETVEHISARISTESEAGYQEQCETWKLAFGEWEAAGAVGKQPARPIKPSPVLPIVDSATAELPSLPKGWAWTRLGFIAEISGGLTKNQKRNELPRRMKYLRVANVYSDRVKLDEVLEIGVTAEEARKTALEPGDLLIVEGNGSIEQIGRVAMWGGELPDCGHQNHLIRARVTTRSNPRFFLNFMLSPLGRKLIVKVASSTTGLHTLSTSKVFNLLVPVTTPTEEALVLTQIEEKLSNIDKLLEDIDTQTKRANLLRQAILRKAFSGELVAQSPEDEPASAMLERIKAEKAGRQAKNYTNKREKAA